MPIHPKQLPTLSPDALAALRLPLRADRDGVIFDALDRYIGEIAPDGCLCENDHEIAAFIAAALNELLTPAAPAEPVRMCIHPDCLDAAYSDEFCLIHENEHRAKFGLPPIAAPLLDPASNTELGQAATAAMEAE